MYEHKKPLSAFGSTLDYDSLPIPEGTNLSVELLGLLEQLPVEMSLPMDGHVTPWAVQDGLSWRPNVESPAENLELYSISSREVREAYDKLFGQPIPYLGVVTYELPTATQIDQALEGTDYEWFETLAVYDQVQTQDAVPPIFYFHWISLREAGEKRSKDLGAAMVEMGGTLVFASRVPYSKTSVRAWPAMDFQTAIDSQRIEVSAEDEAAYTTEVAPKEKNTSFLTAALVATSVAAAVIFVGEAVRK